MTVIPRVGTDWDGDRFICYDCLPSDPLNLMNNTLDDTDPGFVNLHWNYLNTAAINSSTVSVEQIFTDYGIRALQCVTGTDTTAGAYFGYDGSGAADIVVPNATARRGVMWIRATSGAGTSMKLEMVNGGASSTTFTISTSWQRVTLFYTTASTTTGFKITKNSSATNVTFEATGFMITSGATPNGFNVGHSTNRYDIITSDVNSINIKGGKGSWLSAMPAEGIASLTLNNNDRQYSPEYSSGPLYGYIRQRQLMTIDFYRAASSEWRRAFTGWTRPFEPDYGRTRRKKCSMSAEQGIFQLDDNPYRSQTAGETKADAVIRDIVNTVFTSGATPYQVVFDQSDFDACYFDDPDEIMQLDTGVSDLTLTGEDWGPDTAASRVIKDMLDVERGLFFIDRNGKVIFRNRQYYIDPATAPTVTVIDMDDEVNGGKYVHGQAYKNVVRVNYKPSASTADEIVWRSKGNGIRLNGKTKGKKVEVKFEYDDGRKMTVSSINPFNDGSLNASSYAANTLAGVDITDQVSVVLEQLENGLAQLSMTHHGSIRAQITVILRGALVDSAGGETVEVVDSESLGAGRYELPMSVKVLQDETEATNLANYLLDIHREEFGQFLNLTIKSRNDTWAARQLDLEIGDLIELSEYQTGHSSKDYISIGETFDWTPGLLNSTHTLHPQFRTNKCWVLGTSLLGTDTYLGY